MSTENLHICLASDPSSYPGVIDSISIEHQDQTRFNPNINRTTSVALENIAQIATNLRVQVVRKMDGSDSTNIVIPIGVNNPSKNEIYLIVKIDEHNTITARHVGQIAYKAEKLYMDIQAVYRPINDEFVVQMFGDFMLNSSIYNKINEVLEQSSKNEIDWLCKRCLRSDGPLCTLNLSGIIVRTWIQSIALAKANLTPCRTTFSPHHNMELQDMVAEMNERILKRFPQLRDQIMAGADA